MRPVGDAPAHPPPGVTIKPPFITTRDGGGDPRLNIPDGTRAGEQIRLVGLRVVQFANRLSQSGLCVGARS